MFHNRRLNNKFYSWKSSKDYLLDHISTFQELLNKYNSVSKHHRNLQVLATEIFRIHKSLSTDILKEIFVPKISFYNLCRNNAFEIRQDPSVYHGIELQSFLGPKILDLMSLELKQLESLGVFKSKIKKWILLEYPCRFCPTYIQQAGFL